MTTPVVSVDGATSVRDVARLLLDRRISAVPVVDAEAGLIGIISEGDLIHRAEIGTEERHRSWWLSIMSAPGESASEYIKSHGMKVADLMTRDVVTVEEDASIADIAKILEEKHIKRVPVVRRGRVVGIVSRANILQALTAQEPQALTRPSEDDRAVRNRLVDALAREPWADLANLNVIVSDGVVHLWGLVGSDSERRALRIAAENTKGVRRVDDHLGLLPRSYGGV